jgi:hypothetical protein
MSKQQCNCITKKGTRCKRNTTANSKKCYQHQQKQGSNESLQKKYCSCVTKVKTKQGSSVNAFAVCTKSVGRVTNSCKKYEN